MPKFPINAPKVKVIKTLELLGFSIIREREHIVMIKNNEDGTKTPLTMPNHSQIKSSTLISIWNIKGRFFSSIPADII